MNKKVKPLFIISLPRTGSTLLQRILMGHSKISSVAEPWILLPFVFANKSGVISKYGHWAARTGINDLIRNLPGKEDEYDKYLAEFVNKIYSALSDQGVRYFLDKTPRYIQIIPEIAKMFQDAKFIFLFRNPVQVYASMLSIQQFTNNTIRFKSFNHNLFYRDLIEGPALISEGYLSLKSKCYGIQYEKFVLEPEKYLKEITNYLELDFEEQMISDFHKQNLKGQQGDQKGHKLYNKISTDTLEKWKNIINTRYRKSIVLNYLNRIDENIYHIMGYNKSLVMNEVKKLKLNGNYSVLQDIIDYQFMLFRNRYNRIYFK